MALSFIVSSFCSYSINAPSLDVGVVEIVTLLRATSCSDTCSRYDEDWKLAKRLSLLKFCRWDRKRMRHTRWNVSQIHFRTFFPHIHLGKNYCKHLERGSPFREEQKNKKTTLKVIGRIFCLSLCKMSPLPVEQLAINVSNELNKIVAKASQKK